MISRFLSIAGLLTLVLAIGFMYGPGPGGESVFRLDRLLLGLGLGVALFVAAAKTHKG